MSIDISSNKQCESCSTLITTIYGSGRFCNVTCARRFSTSKNREAINKKVSLTMSGKRSWPDKYLESKKVWSDKMAQMKREQKAKRLVKIRGDVLDITNAQLEDYRQKHRVCDMCGVKPDSSRNAYNKNLVVDHCHNTLKFRGLLCISCNRFLGYYENSKTLAEKYLSEH